MTNNILEITDVDQSFRSGFWMKRTQVLHSVALQVPARSVFGFLGANGAGKTTLIHLIVGLRRPTSGQVKVGGIEAFLPEARAKVGYLPERPYFHEHLTGAELLHYFGALAGLKRSIVNERIPKVLASVGMFDARDVELRRYSKGMLQRIGIAQAILHDPEFLVLDEPMSGLDPLGRKEMRELILQLASSGRTIFFSSHVIPDVEAICDRVALIQKGKLIGSGTVESLLSKAATGNGAAVQKAELAVSGVSAMLLQKIEGVEVRELPDGLRATAANQEALDRALRATLETKGGRVLSVTPVRPSLEELFTR
jgi:ABC-2 type transport system ATP-binding protein